MPTRRTVALALASIALPAVASPKLKGGSFSPPLPAPELGLQGSDGQPLTLARYRGKVVLVFFGFTHCAEVCPVTLATLAQMRQSLGPAGKDVQVVWVTVDPERDDVARMATYLRGFDASFVGGTGTPAALAAVYRAWGATATKVKTGSSYAVDHTSSVYLVDRQGRLRGMMPYGRSAADHAHDVRRLLGS